MLGCFPPAEQGPVISIQRDIERFIWSSRLDRRGHLGRAASVLLRYVYALVRDVVLGQLTMRSMSLVYTTLLSVVPLLAFSFAILKGLGVFDQLEPYLSGLLAPLGAQGEEITEQILALVNNVRGSVLGGIGFVFFLYTAISTIQKVEEAFNYVRYVSTPRSLARRFSEYLVVLLVGPMLMVAAIGMLTSIQSNTFVQYLMNNPQLGPIFVLAGKTMPYLIISTVFTFLYMFMPNTRVRFVPALIGGVSGGVMWATLGAAFATFILYSTRTLQIYAGFAVAITTLIWLYLNWLILLIGAQIAFYNQRPAFLRMGRREPKLSNSTRERVALNIMLLVGTAFRKHNRKLEFSDITQTLGLPSLALTPIVNALENAGLLVTTERHAILPGREMSRMRLTDIVDVVRAGGVTGSEHEPAWSSGIDQLGRELDTALNDVLGERTLADLIDATETNSRD